MATTSRAAQFTKLHKTLAKHYQPVSPSSDRPILEQMLFACCLENAPFTAAEEAFATLADTFYDWNEIRVSTIRELAETMGRLPDPSSSASKIRSILQHIFEANYTFDVDDLKKKNLGPAIQSLEEIKGISQFIISYTVQSALEGHSIPLDAGSLEVMRILDLATPEQVKKRQIPGLERSIPKNKGVEFGSLLHHLGAEFIDNPFSKNLHKILLEIDPSCKERLPKRAKKVTKKAAAKKTEPKKTAEKKKTTTKKAAAKKTTKTAAEKKKTTAKRKIAATKKAKKPTVKKTVAKKPTAKKATAKKKTVKKAATKKTVVKKKTSKKSPAKKTTKRKPR
jgi:hypothetical protein